MQLGTPAPAFFAHAIKNGKVTTISEKDLLGKYSLLFFYALDFSFVCPGELHALEDNAAEFEKRNTEIYAISIDSIYTHSKWLEKPRSESGILGTSFTLVSDIAQKMAHAFEVLDHEQGFTLRASFVLDENNIIQYAQANSFAFGRSVKELLRVIDAIQYVHTTGEFCPVNWMPNKK